MRAPAGSLDVSKLPTNVFGARSETWWGMMGFVFVESMMFVVVIGAYFFLRRNFEAYPPLGSPNPELLIPTIELAVVLASTWAARQTDTSTKRLDTRGTQRALLYQVLFGVVILALRSYEGIAVRTRWDTDAYGSVVWLLLVLHTVHLLIDTIESAVMLKVMHRDEVEQKHFVDANDGAVYWYYVALAWVPLYVIIYLVPRWI